MTGRSRRSASMAALASLLFAVPVLAASTAAAAPADGPCPGSSGVTVVVDFRELGGGIVVRCAPGSPGSGLAALEGAGFTATPTLRFPAFVCRIDDRPSAAGEACVTTPPTTAYWSYWRASRGGSWSYSPNGAAGPPAEVEGWSFSLDRTASQVPPPGIAPPGRAVATTTSMPSAATPSTSAPPVSVAGVATTRPVGAGGAAAGPATTSPDATDAAVTTVAPTPPSSPPADMSTTTAPEAGEVRVVAAGSAEGAGSGGSSGSGSGPAAALVAVVIVAALAGGAWWRSRRRAGVALGGPV